MLLIAVSAILFQRSASSTWMEARAATGHQLRISPIGIEDHGPDTSFGPVAQCRWWPKLGDATLCALAPGGEQVMSIVRRAYPLTVVSLWTSVLALFLVALRIPRRAPAAGMVVTMTVPVMALVALWSVASGARRALAVLAEAGASVQPIGFGSMFAGALFMAIAAGLLVSSRIFRRA
jgi:hypothetical protein